jgi:hypothetical protein
MREPNVVYAWLILVRGVVRHVFKQVAGLAV